MSAQRKRESAGALYVRPFKKIYRFVALMSLFLLASLQAQSPLAADAMLVRFLDKVDVAELVPGADAFGPLQENVP
ncbi:MAG: hypothetical protein JJ979_07255, partial [Roseibium sp.]|nr:hypothetical protein [Roseibium sp.]